LVGFLAFWLKNYDQNNKTVVKNQVPQKVTLAILAEDHNSPSNSARELFKPSNDAESLVLQILKIGKFWI